jgi:hypothetical protein
MNGPDGYGRPPAYYDEDNQLQGGSTMRLLTDAVDESQSYMP